MEVIKIDRAPVKNEYLLIALKLKFLLKVLKLFFIFVGLVEN